VNRSSLDLIQLLWKRFKLIMLKNGEREYKSFLSWYTEGSCIEQRMSSGPDQKEFEIPASWKELQKLLDLVDFESLPATYAELDQMIASKINERRRSNR
jgi:hypothetical protein